MQTHGWDGQSLGQTWGENKWLPCARQSPLGSVLLALRSVRFRAEHEHSGHPYLTKCHHEPTVCGLWGHRRFGLLLCLNLYIVNSILAPKMQPRRSTFYPRSRFCGANEVPSSSAASITLRPSSLKSTPITVHNVDETVPRECEICPNSELVGSGCEPQFLLAANPFFALYDLSQASAGKSNRLCDACWVGNRTVST